MKDLNHRGAGHSPSAPEFRIYAVKELAVLYYPSVSPDYASRSFRRLLRTDPVIAAGLSERGFKARGRTLSPAQVRFLVDHLGTPEEFYEIWRSEAKTSS